MGEIRYFTCRNPEDMPMDKRWLSQMSLFKEWEPFAGPVQGETGIPGLRLDFRQGLRLQVPEGNWHVSIYDHDTEDMFLDEDVSDILLISMEKYFVRWAVDVKKDGEPVFSHVFDPEGQTVVFYSVWGAMGDTLAALPYAQAFKEKYHCEVYYKLEGEYLRELAEHLYPGIPQLGEEAPEDTYAIFYLAAWFDTKMGAPIDTRTFPMDEMAGEIVGVHGPAPLPPFHPTRPRVVKGKYVCIAVQASTLSKGWHYPRGWDIVSDYLNALGYRVICIDRHAYQRELNYETLMPDSAEDMTGDRSIMDRANMLYYADFFIGLGSGLSWLAHAVGCPVILISGMSQPWCEFYTPYRILNRHVCHGCFNDIRTRFQSKICPYHNGTERELECSKRISPRQVIAAIDELMRREPRVRRDAGE